MISHRSSDLTFSWRFNLGKVIDEHLLDTLKPFRDVCVTAGACEGEAKMAQY